MAINDINLDQKLSNLNKVAIQIGGKKYNLSVDDELYADFVGVQAEVSAYFAELDESMTDEEFASMSQSERRDVVTGIFVDVKEKMADVIDKVLGEGEGNRLYEYYGKKTIALSYILNELAEIYKKSIKAKKSAKQEKVNRYRSKR